jgi:hypothetical protein
MPENTEIHPVLQLALVAGGYATYCAAQHLLCKRRVRRYQKAKLQTLGEWVSTAHDIRSLPTYLED